MKHGKTENMDNGDVNYKNNTNNNNGNGSSNENGNDNDNDNHCQKIRSKNHAIKVTLII